MFGATVNAQVQTYCISGISDLELNLDCGALDWEFIYTDLDGAFVHTCGDVTDLLDIELSLEVIIDSINCTDESDPKLRTRITRVITADVTDPFSISCPNGPGQVCETQVINYRDTTAPLFSSFPSDSTVTCENWDLLDYLISGVFAVDVLDDCGDVSQVLNLDTIMGECSAQQEFHWEFVLTDGCNNDFSKIHSVYVVDTVAPLVIFLPPITAPFDCLEDIVWPLLEAFDMCSGATVNWDGAATAILHDCPNNMTLTRNATATDACGNTVTEPYSIVVFDAQNPQFVDLLADQTIQCDNTSALDLALLALPTFGDGCNDGAFLNTTSLTTPGICPQNYTLEKTFIVEDACGNTSESLTITITVQDTVAPTITLPTEGFQLECSDVLILEDPVMVDNCDPTPAWTEITVDTGDLSDGDLTSTIIYTATDACGNSSESEVVVNIVDTEPPYFTLFPDNLVVLCGDDYPNDEVSYEDACDPSASLVDYDLQFDFQPCANNTLITRTFTIRDAAGNEDTQTQTITFLDEDPPVLLTPLDSLFYQCAYEVPDCLEIFEGLDFEDCSNGDVVPIDCDDVVVEGNCEEQACILERTYYFEDACGNVGSTKQYITVQESVLAPEMPTGITPNGDGLNDAFVIKGIGPSLNPEPGEIQCDWLEDTNMRVINRWGSLVFEQDNYRNDWEGTNESGEDLPQGTYFVVFEALGESFSTYLDLRR